MTGRKLRGGRFAKAALLALAALAIGSVFATAQNGQASSKVAPNNTAPPTISGTTQSGSTLTASTGTFTGTTPLTYTYVWSRCDASGRKLLDDQRRDQQHVRAADTSTSARRSALRSPRRTATAPTMRRPSRPP